MTHSATKGIVEDLQKQKSAIYSGGVPKGKYKAENNV